MKQLPRSFPSSSSAGEKKSSVCKLNQHSLELMEKVFWLWTLDEILQYLKKMRWFNYPVCVLLVPYHPPCCLMWTVLIVVKATVSDFLWDSSLWQCLHELLGCQASTVLEGTLILETDGDRKKISKQNHPKPKWFSGIWPLKFPHVICRKFTSLVFTPLILCLVFLSMLSSSSMFQHCFDKIHF